MGSRYTKAARGQSCVHCGRDDGTVVAAHINGPMSSSLGRGMGQKPDDIFCAHLCHRCHDAFDGRVAGGMTQEEKDRLWPLLVLRTIYRLRRMGLL
jgi:hypothetical protein